MDLKSDRKIFRGERGREAGERGESGGYINENKGGAMDGRIEDGVMKRESK